MDGPRLYVFAKESEWVCVCVCVCVWERERESERQSIKYTDRKENNNGQKVYNLAKTIFLLFPLSTSKSQIIQLLSLL